MKRIIRLKDGDAVPNGARFLHSTREPNYSRSRHRTEPNPHDPVNYIPLFGSLFGTDRVIRETPVETIFYYEIETGEPEQIQQVTNLNSEKLGVFKGEEI